MEDEDEDEEEDDDADDDDGHTIYSTRPLNTETAFLVHHLLLSPIATSPRFR